MMIIWQQHYQLQGTVKKQSRKQEDKLKDINLYLSNEYLYYSKKGDEPTKELYLVLVRLDILNNNGFKLTRNR